MNDFNKIIAENEVDTTDTLSVGTIDVLTKDNKPNEADGLSWIMDNTSEDTWNKVFDNLIKRNPYGNQNK